MTRDALCSEQTAAHELANVPSGGKQTDGTQEEKHSNWNAAL
jgi:hypothetical protein